MRWIAHEFEALAVWEDEPQDERAVALVAAVLWPFAAPRSPRHPRRGTVVRTFLVRARGAAAGHGGLSHGGLL